MTTAYYERNKEQLKLNKQSPCIKCKTLSYGRRCIDCYKHNTGNQENDENLL